MRVKPNDGFGRGGFLTCWRRPKFQREGGQIFGDDEILMSNFFSPKYLLGDFAPYELARKMRWVWLLQISTGTCSCFCYPWRAPSASFALFCILNQSAWLCLFLEILRRHGATALLKSMGSNLFKARFGTTPQKWAKNDQNWVWVVLLYYK